MAAYRVGGHYKVLTYNELHFNGVSSGESAIGGRILDGNADWFGDLFRLVLPPGSDCKPPETPQRQFDRVVEFVSWLDGNWLDRRTDLVGLGDS